MCVTLIGGHNFSGPTIEKQSFLVLVVQYISSTYINILISTCVTLIEGHSLTQINYSVTLGDAGFFIRTQSQILSFLSLGKRTQE